MLTAEDTLLSEVSEDIALVAFWIVSLISEPVLEAVLELLEELVWLPPCSIPASWESPAP